MPASSLTSPDALRPAGYRGGARTPDLDMRLLVGRRRDLVDEQTRRIGRLRDLLVSIFLERAFDYTTKGPLWLVSKYVTPAELRQAGRARIIRHLQHAGSLRNIEALADRALDARGQTISVPGERISATLIRELAIEALSIRKRIAEPRQRAGDPGRSPPDSALIRSLPGMGHQALRRADRRGRQPPALPLRRCPGRGGRAAPVLRSPARSAFSSDRPAAIRP